jgi:hypothetical protein
VVGSPPVLVHFGYCRGANTKPVSIRTRKATINSHSMRFS